MQEIYLTGISSMFSSRCTWIANNVIVVEIKGSGDPSAKLLINTKTPEYSDAIIIDYKN